LTPPYLLRLEHLPCLHGKMRKKRKRTRRRLGRTFFDGPPPPALIPCATQSPDPSSSNGTRIARGRYMISGFIRFSTQVSGIPQLGLYPLIEEMINISLRSLRLAAEVQTP